MVLIVDMNYNTYTYLFNNEYYGIAYQNISNNKKSIFKYAVSFNYRQEKIQVIDYMIQRKSPSITDPSKQEDLIKYILEKVNSRKD